MCLRAAACISASHNKAKVEQRHVALTTRVVPLRPAYMLRNCAIRASRSSISSSLARRLAWRRSI
jgi:hypothetical protein